MYAVMSKDIFGDIKVICICKTLGVAKLITKARNKKYENSSCWYQWGEVVEG